MKNSLVKTAFLRSLPVMAGYVVLGIGFGILLGEAGFGPLWALLFSLLVFAGSMQFVGVSLISGGASVLVTAMTTLMVNARHIFYSVSMYDTYRGAGKKKPLLIFTLTDETYSLLCDGKTPEGEDPHTYRLLVSLFNYGYWVLGSFVGGLLGQVIPFDTTGIDFSMTALFVTVFVEQWTGTKEHRPALLGVAATVLCLVLFGQEIFLIPSMVVITLALTALRPSLEGGAARE
ncbi:MAG: AzlC family ABC transporter permease [Clostridia bacterium]|nr:AzlC family ABC transporter permease [Clostridia bacterium]